MLAPSVAKSTQVKALQELCAELRCSAAVRALSDEVTPSNSADRRLAIVLADLNPMLSPEWRGMRVDRVGLENEARLVVEDGPRATGRLDDLRESGVLGVWPMLAGCEKHGVLADAWAQQCRQLRSAVEAEASRGAGMISEQALRQANAWLLLTCLESGHLAALAKRHAAISVDAARRQEWFRRLHDLAKPGHDAIAMLVSMCYAPVATERQNAKDAEDRRLAAEEARRAKEAADAALAAARTRRATKSLKFQWAATLTLVLTSFVLITLGVTNDPSFIVENAGAMPKFVRDWPTAYAGVGGELSLERAEPQLLYVGIILGLWALVSLVSAFVLRAISRGSRRAFGEFWLSQRWIVFPLAAVCFAAYAPWIIYGGIIAILVVVGLTLAIIIGRVISSG